MRETLISTPEELAEQQRTVNRILIGLRLLIPEVRVGPYKVLKKDANVKQNGREVRVYSPIAVRPYHGKDRKKLVMTLTWSNAYRVGKGEGKLPPFTQVRASESAFDPKLGELLNQRVGELQRSQKNK